MSAPPLPEAFGNYALQDFVEVVAPAPVSWLPQTAGWFWVAVILGLWLARRLWRRWRRWYRDRYRREALLRLEELRHSCPPEHYPREVNRLLKLTALAAWSRARVARLSGPEWVNFLNQNCASVPFDSELARLLETGPYGSPVPDQRAGAQLLAASKAWIMQHRGPADV